MRKKNYVSNSFTILESLMGLMVMGVICVLILQVMLTMTKTTNDYYNERQTILFLMQIQNDLLGTKDITSNNNIFTLEQYDDNNITYGLKNNKIFRSSTQIISGGEVVLTNVKLITFTISDNVLMTSIEYKNENKTKEYTIGSAKFK